jgi:hypothetical protein
VSLLLLTGLLVHLSLAYFTLVSVVVVLVDLALILDIRKLCELYTEIVHMCTFALKDKISQGTTCAKHSLPRPCYGSVLVCKQSPIYAAYFALCASPTLTVAMNVSTL